jgi:hypothetical protein
MRRGAREFEVITRTARCCAGRRCDRHFTFEDQPAHGVFMDMSRVRGCGGSHDVFGLCIRLPAQQRAKFVFVHTALPNLMVKRRV